MKKITLLKTKVALLIIIIILLVLSFTISTSFIPFLSFFVSALVIILILPIWNKAQMTRLKYFEENSKDHDE